MVKHLVLVHALYQILNKVLIKMFDFIFDFFVYIKIPQEFGLISVNCNTKKAFYDSLERLISFNAYTSANFV